MAGFDVQRIASAFQMGRQIKNDREDRERQAEDRKIQKQMLDLQMKELKLKDALAQRNLQGITSGGPTGQATTTQGPRFQPSASAPEAGAAPQTSPDLNEGIQAMLMKIRQQPVAAQPMSQPGLETGSMATGTPPAFPDIESPYGMVPGTNREMEQERGIADLLRQHTMDAQKAGMVATAQKQAEAPFAPPRNIDPLSPEGADTKIRIDNATRVPPIPRTVTTEQGVFILNPDGSLGSRLGDRPRPAQSGGSSEPLVQTLDDQGNLVWTPRSQAGGMKAPPTRLAPGEQPLSPYSQERARRVVADVDSLKSKVNRASVGFGSLLSVIPETQAREFKAQLDSLKANIAFNELNAMREASKTGGALGQVSVRELELLESALGALDTGQSPSEFTSQLDKIKASIERWQAAAASYQTRTPPPTVGALDFDGIRFPTQQALDEYKRRTGQ